MNVSRSIAADELIDPLVRRYVVIAVRRIIKTGPGRTVCPQAYALKFDCEWFERAAKVLKAQLEDVSVLVGIHRIYRRISARDS